MGSFLQGGGQTPGGGITVYRAASPSLREEMGICPHQPLSSCQYLCVLLLNTHLFRLYSVGVGGSP